MIALRRRLLLSTLVLGAGLISPAVALGAAHGTDLPLRGTLSGIASTDTATNPSPGTVQSSGQISHLGAVTANSDFTLTPRSPLPMVRFDVAGALTLVAANGDQLFTTFTGTLVTDTGTGHSTGTNFLTITGGTGRFTDATGALTEAVSAQITSQVGTVVSGPITLTIQGRISY